jgi:cell division protein FtsW
MVVTTALMAIGVVMVASTSLAAPRALFAPGWIHSPFGRQLAFVGAGMLILAAARLGSRAILPAFRLRRRLVQMLFAVTVLGLAAALTPGLARETRGSHRWLRFAIGGFDLGVQPSEVAKVTMVLALAWLLGGRAVDPRSFGKSFLPAALTVAFCVALVGKEDFGTSAIIAGVGGLMLLVAGCRFSHLFGLGVLGSCGMAALIWAEPYRWARLTAYRDVWADPRGGGYQPIQSLASISSGGWFGEGLGSGLQKYGYLPECHTDFIFAIICEETGMLGAGLVIALFGALVWFGMRTVAIAATRFERLAAFGITAAVGLQAALNIAVVTVVTPTTGVSLPLVSSGGSGLLTYSVAIGILLAIADRGASGADIDSATEAESAVVATARG